MDNILLIGGHSKLGLAMRNNDQFSGNYVCRKAGNGDGALSVNDYSELSSSDIRGFSTVYSLAGTSAGDVQQLQKVNVDLALHLANESKKADVKKFFYISSFSVFGNANNIRKATIPRPVSIYGQSKFLAENRLKELSVSSFSVTIVRLPMLYGFGDSKLEKLLKIWLLTRILPVSRFPSRRSMLHYDMAADVLLRLRVGEWPGVVALADPQPFCLEEAAQILSGATKRKIRIFRLGAIFMFPLRIFRPNLYQSLFTSSYLENSANVASELGLESRIDMDLATFALRQIYEK